jgi:hypothetical protein
MSLYKRIPVPEKEPEMRKLLSKVAKSQNAIYAQEVVRERLTEAYGHGIKVDFSETLFEESKDGRGFWLVEGNVAVKKWLLLKKVYHFLYYIDTETGKITVMRGKRQQ